MNQLQIQKIIKEIAEKANFGQIIFKKQEVDTFMSFDNVYYYEEGNKLEFSYGSEYLEDCTPCFRIDISNIKNIVATKDMYDTYEFRIELEDLYSDLVLVISLPEGQTFTSITLGNRNNVLSTDQLFAILSKHKTGFFIDVNNRDLMRNNCYNFEFECVYFTNVMSLRKDKMIAFTNTKQMPIGKRNGTNLYHISSNTSFYIDRVRIDRIEEENSEQYNDLFGFPLKAVYNIYLQENADGLEDIVTVGLI